MAFTLKNLFQIQGALYIIYLIGFILAIFKVFTAPEVWPLYEVIRLSSYSAMAYNIIGNTQLTMDNWKPYFPIAIAQLIIHLLIVIATFAIKSKSKLTAYVRFATSFAFQETTVFIYQILDVVFPTKYKAIAVMYLITEEFIYLPILKILMFVYSHTNKEQDSQEEPEHDEEEDSLQEQDGLEGIEDEEVNEANHQAEEENEDEEKKEDIEKKQATDKPAEPEIKPPTLTSTIITAWVNTNTICIILGFVWAAIKINMPALMKNFITDLTKCVTCSIIFSIGVVAGSVNLWRFHVFIPVNLAVNYVLFPLLVGGLCKGFKISSEQTKSAVLMAVAPTGLFALHRMPDDDQMIGPRISFVWSSLLWLPFAYIWGAILLYTNLF